MRVCKCTINNVDIKKEKLFFSINFMSLCKILDILHLHKIYIISDRLANSDFSRNLKRLADLPYQDVIFFKFNLFYSTRLSHSI